MFYIQLETYFAHPCIPVVSYDEVNHCQESPGLFLLPQHPIWFSICPQK